MKCDVRVVIPGFPAKYTYGPCGLSSIYLVETGKRKMLFDTGGFGQRRELFPRLKAMGHPAESFEIVVLSHAHWDHMMNVPYFSNADIYLHAEDMKFANAKVQDVDRAYPLPYMRDLLSTRHLRCWEGDSTLVEGVQLIHTPGHTPGSISAVVETEWGRTVLCGDTIKNRAEYFSEEYDVRGDEQTFHAGVKRIRALADAIAPGHDRPFDTKSGKYLADGDREPAIIANFEKNIQKESVCKPMP